MGSSDFGSAALVVHNNLIYRCLYHFEPNSNNFNLGNSIRLELESIATNLFFEKLIGFELLTIEKELNRKK